MGLFFHMPSRNTVKQYIITMLLVSNVFCFQYSVDGGWTLWGNWSSCSVSCGIGSKTRKRTCSNPVPNNGGIKCLGNNTQVHSCFDRACPGIVSVFSV